MDIKELENLIEISLIHFKMPFVKHGVSQGLATLFVIEDFGLVVCCFAPKDYVQVTGILANKYSDWRRVLVSDSDDAQSKRFEILWNLMRGGYMKWLRYNFPRQTNNILNGVEEFRKAYNRKTVRNLGR